MATSSIIEYIKLIKSQQAFNLDRPKLDNLISSFSPFYTESEAITEILTLSYKLLSCKQFNDKYYWEFILNNNISDFTKFKFIYISVTPNNFNTLKKLIPNYYYWNSLKEVSFSYLNKVYFLDTDASSWGESYSTKVTSGINHTFLPTWEFTGKLVLLSNKLLYEYIDIKGWAGPKDFRYLSPLRPINLNYPLGLPSTNNLELDPCYNSSKNLYAKEGNSNFAGKYIGQYTNDSYNKHIKFWLYRNNISTFLSEYPPTYNTESLALSSVYQFNNKAITHLFSTSESSFNLSQISTTSIINL